MDKVANATKEPLDKFYHLITTGELVAFNCGSEQFLPVEDMATRKRMVKVIRVKPCPKSVNI